MFHYYFSVFLVPFISVSAKKLIVIKNSLLIFSKKKCTRWNIMSSLLDPYHFISCWNILTCIKAVVIPHHATMTWCYAMLWISQNLFHDIHSFFIYIIICHWNIRSLYLHSWLLVFVVYILNSIYICLFII